MIYAPVRHRTRTISMPCETTHVDESFKEAAIDINARKISFLVGATGDTADVPLPASEIDGKDLLPDDCNNMPHN